jgi:hypothetical protein
MEVVPGAKHEWSDMSKKNAPGHTEWKKITLGVPIRLKDMKFVYALEVFPSVYI